MRWRGPPPGQGGDPAASQEPQNDGQRVVPSGMERKEHFFTILLGGLDDENGGSDTNLLVALDAENKTINVASLPRDTLLDMSFFCCGSWNKSSSSCCTG